MRQAWLLLAGLCLACPLAAAPEPARTCFRTGAGDLLVCHAPGAQGVYAHPSPLEIEYNTQIVQVGAGRYAAVLHSEAKDFDDYLRRTGAPRPGDSIKVGIQDTAGHPDQALRLPSTLAFRLWGSLSEQGSPLFYAYGGPTAPETGLSGGANPMVVAGRTAAGDPVFYVTFLGVAADPGPLPQFRNVLLAARTADFARFEVLQALPGGGTGWVPFAGEHARPVIVTDTSGNAIRSNHAAPVEPPGSTDPGRPPGSVLTAGLIGSIVQVQGRYHYFYTDQDPEDPARNHLYERTAETLDRDGAWSPPVAILDVLPEVIVRVAKARFMDRWAVVYSCLRSRQPYVTDICLQYTGTLDILGPKGLAGLTLFPAPHDGTAPFALGLQGSAPDPAAGGYLRSQQFYMTDPAGNMTAPPNAAGDVGGVLTWLELPMDRHLLGAPTYWAEWTVVALPPGASAR